MLLMSASHRKLRSVEFLYHTRLKCCVIYPVSCIRFERRMEYGGAIKMESLIVSCGFRFHRTHPKNEKVDEMKVGTLGAVVRRCRV